MAMTFGDMKTEVRDVRFQGNNDITDRIGRWVNLGLAQVWYEKPWTFRKATGPVGVTVGSSATTVPADFGSVIALYDANGERVPELDALTFADWYPTVTSSGPVEAFTVTNGVVTVAPLSDISGTLTVRYLRDLVPLALDTDVCPLPPPYDYLPVVAALLTPGLPLMNDDTVDLLEGTYNRLIRGLAQGYLDDSLSPQMWPRDRSIL